VTGCGDRADGRQIRARSVGLPPVVGVDEEIDRLRDRDPLPPVVVPIAALPDLLVARHWGERLALDLDQPGVAAILRLFVQLRAVEAGNGSWNGGDVVAIVSEWFSRLGIDPDRPLDQLAGRVFTTVARRRERAGPGRAVGHCAGPRGR